MVTAAIRLDDLSGLMALVPRHRERVDELIRSGQILGYTVAADRSRLWMTILAENESSVCNLLDSLPLQPYLQPEIQAALLFDSQAVRLPQVFLN